MRKKSYIGRRVRIISITNNLDVIGMVTSIDDQGRLHGTWGDYVPSFKEDYILLEE